MGAFRAVVQRETINTIYATFIFPGPGTGSTAVAINAFALNDLATLQYHNQVLTYGVPSALPLVAAANGALNFDTALSTPQEAVLIRSSVFSNGCDFLAQAAPSSFYYTQPFNYSECLAFESGIVARGLDGALQSFVAQSNALIVKRTGATYGYDGMGVDTTGAPFNVATVINNDIQAITDLSFKFLQPAFTDISRRYAAAAYANVHTVAVFQAGFTAAFIVCFVGAFVFAYLPQLGTVNREIKEQRMLLLLLPSLMCLCLLGGVSLQAGSSSLPLPLAEELRLWLLTAGAGDCCRRERQTPRA